MNKKLIHKFFEKSAATLIAIALILTGVCFFEGNVNMVSASESEIEDATLTDDGYYVKKFTTDQFGSYRKKDEDGNYSYPKFSDSDWLFAGWFTDEACQTAVGSDVTTVSDAVYAKFVDADLSYIKCQVTPGTDVKSEKTNMRIISAMESNLYSGAGFYVTYKGGTRTCSVSTLYARLSATDDNMECGYSPAAFNEDGKYFSAVRLINIGNANFDEPFYIQSYWKTLDGTTVSGMSRYARIEDSYNQIVNVPVRMYSDAKVTGGSITVSYSTEQFSLYKTDEYTTGYDAGTVFDSVTIDTSTDDKIIITGSLGDGADAVTADGIIANLRLHLKADVGLESNTIFEVIDESFKNGDSDVALDVSAVVFKNYPLAYGGTPDKSWYDEFCDEDEETYVISSAADLYGLAEIVNSSTGDYASEQFTNDKIILGADITINDVTAKTKDEWENLLNNSEPDHSWTPIGTKPHPFKGKFDGGGHSISGIYFCDDSNADAEYCGLFGDVDGRDLDVTLENFSIKNSYFESEMGWCSDDTSNIEYAMLGSVAGRLMSVDVYSVSSEAIVVSEGRDVGGFIGRAQNGVTIDDCWFDGEVYVEQETETANWYVGGFVGNAFNDGELNLDDCLNTGTVKLNYATKASSTPYLFMGGFVGGNEGNKGTMNLMRCVHAGYVSAQYNGTDEKHLGVSVFVGVVNTANSTANVTDSYVTEGSFLGYHCQSVNSGKVVTSNLIETPETELVAHLGYVNATNLDFYDAHATGDTNGKWVATETGIPMLKNFTEHWIDVKWYYDDTDADTFVIDSVEDLYGLAVIVNNTSENFSGHNVVLGADIKVNAGNAALWANGTVTPTRAFTPIGNANDVFSGNFNGQDYTISGIYINESSNSGVGLFGNVNAAILNLRLENSCVKSGTTYTGSIAGYSSANISNVYSDAYVISSADYTGGLLGGYTGKAATTVSNSWYDGQLSTSAQVAGGIAGHIYMGTKSLQNCLFTGTIESSCPENSVNGQVAYVGGMIGYSAISTSFGDKKVTIDNCVSVGTIKSLYNVHNIASLVGRAQNDLTIKNAYTTIEDTWTAIRNFPGVGHNSVNGNGTFTGMVSKLEKDEIIGLDAYKYTELDFYSVTNTDGKWAVIDDEQLVLKELYTGNGQIIDDFSSVQQISTGWYHNNVIYTSYNSKNVAIEENTNYTIGDEADLYGLERIVNNGYNFNSKTVTLTADMDLNPDWKASSDAPDCTWTPIGNSDTAYFDGIFNGGMKTIKGVYVNGTTANAGLFGYVGLNGTIQSLRLENSYMTSSAGTLGSVVGLLQGNVEEVYSKADVVSTGAYTGGIVGDFIREDTKECEISNCWFEGTLNSSGNYCGGIVGRLKQGNIHLDNLLNTGTITSTYTNNWMVYCGGLIGGVRYGSNGNTYVVANLSNSVSAGTVKVAGTNAGSVTGGAMQATLVVKNVYTTDNVIKTTDGDLDKVLATTGTGRYSVSNVKFTGCPIAMTTELNGEDAYIYTELDFYTKDNTDGIWGIVEDSTPVLTSFADYEEFDATDKQRQSAGWYYNAITYSWSGTSDADYTTTNATQSYTITKADDLWGLAELVNNKNNTFADMTITLANSITLNDGDADDWASDETSRPKNSWIPIGTTTIPFKGKFDGGENTISGLYMSIATQNSGLFGATTKATIQNLRLENSYLECTCDTNGQGAIIGSIIGFGDGTLENVYSNAYVVAYEVQVGGLVGRPRNHTTYADTDLSVTNCWYDGTIIANLDDKAQMCVGGFLGIVFNGSTTIDNCLYTGNIICNYTPDEVLAAYNLGVGGFVGLDRNNGGYVEISDSIAAGTIEINWNVNENNVYTNDSDEVVMPTANAVCDVIGVAYHASSKANDTVVAVTDIVKNYKYIEGNQEKEEEGTNAYTTGGSASDSNFVINTTWANANILSDSPSYNEQYLRGLGAYFQTSLPFTTDVDTNIWAARHSALPVPSTLTDVVADAIEPNELVIPNVEWYGEGTDTVYTINTVEELYGFAQLSHKYNFEGKIVNLGADIHINSSEEDGTAKEWEAGTTTPTMCWYPVGRAGKPFAGTFNGCDHEITGLYMNQEIPYMGMFANTTYQSKLQNFELKNSYLHQRGETEGAAGATGSIVGELKGSMNNIYSDAFIFNEKLQTGGLIGILNGYNSGTVTEVALTNCWYNGLIVTGENSRFVGGIVADVIRGKLTMQNVEATGSIEYNYKNTTANAYVGGLIGYTRSNNTETVSINSAISAIALHLNDSVKRVGSVIGFVSANSSVALNVELTNVFATRDCFDVPYTIENDTITVTGTVLQTTGADRLMGYGTQETGHALDFENEKIWSLRTDDVPVLKCFKDNVTNVITSPSAAAMATEVGLTYWNANASITDAKASGGGNYLISYQTTDSLTYAAYIAKLVDELGFTLYTNNSASDMDTDGVVAATYYKAATETTGEWVLNLTYTEADSTVYISINTDLDSRDDNLVSATGDGSAAISLSMVELVNESRYGNSFVFQLPNGHFIVNDGGMTADAETLVTYLKELAGTSDQVQNPVYIDAWIITHYHNDHAGALHAFYTTPTLRNGVYLKAVYASEPSLYGLTSWDESHIGTVNNALRGAMTLTKSETDLSKPDVYQMHMGQRYYFYGMTMDVIDTQEQHHTSTWGTKGDPDKFNATSTNCLYNFADATGVMKKVLIGGDSTNVNMRYIMDVYPNSKTLSDINIFVAYHHGKNTTSTYSNSTVSVGDTSYAIKGTATKDWADFLLKNKKNTMEKFDAVLFPYHQVFDAEAKETWTASDGAVLENVYVGDDGSVAFPYNMTEINKYFKDNANAYYTYGYEDKIATTNAESHGTVKIVFDGNNTTTAATRKANVDAEVGETQ